MTTTTPSQMPPKPPTRIPLTLIVATTPSLGIGLRGSLPWPSLKSEMAYFARVTKRPPPPPPPAHKQPPPTQAPSISPPTAPLPRTINAVMMGRTTYSSIPPKFRPLRDRLNIVLTRSPPGDAVRAGIESEGAVVVGSMGEAMGLLRGRLHVSPDDDRDAGTEMGVNDSAAEMGEEQQKDRLGRVFVIGGAEVYAQALEMGACVRILRTRVEREFECDVFFPVGLGGGDGGWKKAGKREFDEWVGEDVPEGLQSQGDVRWEYEMWERDWVD